MIKNICVYAASSQQVPLLYLKEAELLGKALAKADYTLIYGAGKQGLMGSCANACLANRGKVIGIIPQFMVDQGWAKTNVTQLIITETIHQRKELMASKSQACIALPGGCGTLEELLEIITWKQLGLYLYPIIILNINNFYTPLLTLLDKAVNENFMRTSHKDLWKVAHSVEEALSLITSTPVWNKEEGKFTTK